MRFVIQPPAPYSNPIKRTIPDLILVLVKLLSQYSYSETDNIDISTLVDHGTDFCDWLGTYVRRRDRSQYGVGERYGSTGSWGELPFSFNKPFFLISRFWFGIVLNTCQWTKHILWRARVEWCYGHHAGTGRRRKRHALAKTEIGEGSWKVNISFHIHSLHSKKRLISQGQLSKTRRRCACRSSEILNLWLSYKRFGVFALLCISMEIYRSQNDPS
jgi:hypothetical protein